MAICKYCNQDMETAKSCTVTHLEDFADGIPTKRIRYVGNGRCHDCGVKPGGFHHPGCDWEECPRCHLQAIFSCTCELKQELEDEDE